MEFKDTFGPKGEDDVTLYTVAIGEIRPYAIGRKAKQQKAALHFIMGLDGFVGFHPVPGRGTLCLFQEKNQAIRARNLLMAQGCQCGSNIGECFVSKADLEKYGKKG